MVADRFAIAEDDARIEASQRRKSEDFARLHAEDAPFVIPNPWDAGTAKILHAMGFSALATTSGGLAGALGKVDRNVEVTREDTLDNARQIVAATPLPVSVDLEDGFGRSPETVAETIALTASIGAVSGSIEDSSGRVEEPIRPFDESVERIEAAVDAARNLDFPFMITARAENFLYGRLDLDDTVARLQAFAKVGADVLYAPALPDAESIRRVCAAVDRPVNVLLGAGQRLTVPELFDLGVRRVSLGSSLSRAALGAFKRAAAELLEHGTCEFARDALTMADMRELMGK
ncbi:isocitrate lyase/phosphoenolpyruvate mutase family protein [Glycomyces sp. L485]|uniref:isocitrate lyase/PEP mutase family protein n=1 Tax=Glycomyces sp. L485 TaxID=2909235 RepID=UPI001F4B4F69|nr:isocitrate lyase/phosphoenolpyruvate mutase family protein [Glycomyces sp. L485]MCH7230947.1 isocitrate lyase/phosphoenolpyruvate mutase family protein [Glycomyces sp. L485]